VHRLAGCRRTNPQGFRCCGGIAAGVVEIQERTQDVKLPGASPGFITLLHAEEDAFQQRHHPLAFEGGFGTRCVHHSGSAPGFGLLKIQGQVQRFATPPGCVVMPPRIHKEGLKARQQEGAQRTGAAVGGDDRGMFQKRGDERLGGILRIRRRAALRRAKAYNGRQ